MLLTDRSSASPVRILHVAAGNLFGGVETQLVTFARYRERVPELESEFALCFDGRLARDLAQAAATVHRLGEVKLRDPLALGRANLTLRRLLRERKYDAVITHGAWPHAVAGLATKLSGVELVTWGHGAPLEPSFLDRVADWITPDLLILNSRHTGEAFGALFAKAKKHLVYYPVENRAPQRTRAELRRELNTPESTVVIAFAARFERWKGHTLLLRAARALLNRTSSDWRIWICGGVQRPSEEAYLAELRQYVESAGLTARVQFLGQRSDVPDVLAAADVFCQPNTDPEPFGIVFVEALYAGLPVVSTDMGGAAEIVTPACGILSAAEPEAVADALARVVTDTELRAALAAHAPARARDLCDPEARIRELAQAIRG